MRRRMPSGPRSPTTHPILKDQGSTPIGSTPVTQRSSAAGCGRYAKDRLADITKTRNRVLTDPDTIYQFDRVRELALQELAAGGRTTSGG